MLIDFLLSEAFLQVFFSIYWFGYDLLIEMKGGKPTDRKGLGAIFSKIKSIV